MIKKLILIFFVSSHVLLFETSGTTSYASTVNGRFEAVAQDGILTLTATGEHYSRYLGLVQAKYYPWVYSSLYGWLYILNEFDQSGINVYAAGSEFRFSDGPTSPEVDDWLFLTEGWYRFYQIELKIHNSNHDSEGPTVANWVQTIYSNELDDYQEINLAFLPVNIIFDD